MNERTHTARKQARTVNGHVVARSAAGLSRRRIYIALFSETRLNPKSSVETLSFMLYFHLS